MVGVVERLRYQPSSVVVVQHKTLLDPRENAPPRALERLKPFWIGKLEIEVPLILAPMAGVSEAPFRVMALEAGAGLAPTELVSAKGLEYRNARTEAFLRHDARREPMLSVQIYGGEPSSMARAAEVVVERGAKIVDLNMGCPVKKVTKSGAGSALLTDPERAGAIVTSIRRRIGDAVPVTAKIRSGWDEATRNVAAFGKMLEDAGVAAIALHPRTRTQGYSGRADWSEIRRLKESVRIPVFANGDIASIEDAHRVVEQTGCDAVMIGRAALGRPWIFRDLRAALRGEPSPTPPTPRDRAELVLRHLSEHIEHVGDEARGLRTFRQQIIWYSRGLRDHGTFRDRVMRLEDRETLEELVERFFSEAESLPIDEAVAYDERQAHG